MTSELEKAEIISFKEMLIRKAKKQNRDNINYGGKNYTIGYDDTLYSNEYADLLIDVPTEDPV